MFSSQGEFCRYLICAHLSSCGHLGCGRRFTLRSSNYKVKFVRAIPKWNKICKVIRWEALVFSRNSPSLPGFAWVCAVVAATLPPLKVAGQPRDFTDPGQCPAAKIPDRCHSVIQSTARAGPGLVRPRAWSGCSKAFIQRAQYHQVNLT